MKRLLAYTLILVLLLTAGCNNTDDKASSDDNFASNNQKAQNPNNRNDQTLKSTLDQLVADGVLTESKAEELLQYMKENPFTRGEKRQDQQMDSNSGRRANPFNGAVEEGIITQDQADSIQEKLMTGGQGMNQGVNQGTGQGQNSRKAMDHGEAQSIEASLLEAVGYTSKTGGYPIVDTGTTAFYSNTSEISELNVGDRFYGQDAQYQGNAPSYTNNGDGTITDNVTGLMWQQDPGEKMTWEEAVENLETFRLAGYDDWRLPTIKELYSLVQFNGVTGRSSEDSTPYLDTDYFEFFYGDVTGERFIDSQMATSTIYESFTFGNSTTMFGFNFADGRIKGYPTSKEFYVYYVRGNTNYGQNQFIDNGDGTITDEATGLMWMTYDSGYYNTGDKGDGTMDWEDALTWCEDLEFAGYDDWKLPDAKELQSLVDYTRSPDTTNSAAIDELFYSTPITNLLSQEDYGFYWTSSTHMDGMNRESNAIYIAFGRGLGSMHGEVMDVHGAGCQRSDPKAGDRDNYPKVHENAPQGDVVRVFNMVRAVRVVK